MGGHRFVPENISSFYLLPLLESTLNTKWKEFAPQNSNVGAHNIRKSNPK